MIIPLVDQWTWVGGITSYARFRHPEQNDVKALEQLFWTDAAVRADFKTVIAAVATRVNTINGIAYRDDPTIMAWEVRGASRAHACKDHGLVHGWPHQCVHASDAVVVV